MSTVRANNYYDASGGSNAQLYGVASPPNSMGFRNRILNGSMVIDQRNAGASVTPTVQGYTLDRWRAALSAASKYSVQQSSTTATGFTKSLLATSLSAYSVGAAEWFGFQQSIEGFNVADLGWGAAGAQTVTLSFWVRSSLTGTFGGSLANSDASRSYPFSYTISAANTFEYKTVTISGDTSGTWLTTNGIGIRVSFGLGVGTNFSSTAGSWASAEYYSTTGATNVLGTNGATFYITGVQLEAGTVASPFERRDYGRELMMCQRYLYTMGGAFNGSINFTQYSLVAGLTTTTGRVVLPFPVAMRAAPSFSAVSIANTVVNYGGTPTSLSAATIDVGSPNSCSLTLTYATNGAANSAGNWYQNSSSASQILFSAEL